MADFYGGGAFRRWPRMRWRWLHHSDGPQGAVTGKATLAGALALPVQFDFRPATGAALRRSFAHVLLCFPLGMVRVDRGGDSAGHAVGVRLETLARNEFGLCGAGARAADFRRVVYGRGVIVSSSPYLENFTRLQPMRAFQLLYAIFFVMLGGLLGEHVLRRVAWRWAALVVPLAAGMWMLGQATYPDSAHIELPGANPRERLERGVLLDSRQYSEAGGVCAGPRLHEEAGEDLHGFRAVAERSALADRVKDSGAVSLFPGLAEQWQREVRATEGWEHFGAADFESAGERLRRELDCPQQAGGRPRLPVQRRRGPVCRLN